MRSLNKITQLLSRSRSRLFTQLAASPFISLCSKPSLTVSLASVCLCISTVSFGQSSPAQNSLAQNSPAQKFSNPNDSAINDSASVSGTNTATINIENQAQAIVAIEAEYGPYDLRLQEPLHSLAQELQTSGDHQQALIAFDRALHVTRINKGLIDESQLVLVDQMIDSEIALQNWDGVDSRYAYMEYLYRKLYDIEDPRLELGLEKVVAWHVNAVNINIDGKRVEHLRQANKLFKLRLEIAERTLSSDHPKLNYLQENIALSEYHLYVASDSNRDLIRRQEMTHRDSFFARLD